ncbi:hypothetical protein [Novipirellula artificiosorum]|uniref:Uncharacterized protein n=1 Tax=Novipirellula artificiosorum TaxID=2528016 RepID=A0A5C6D7Y0_9BACT|nr:hypothetical protein [Novipirellula artificiosorum]TWU32175.1 hypothetical protein Poly41_56600 [Novipirellula artificiosorum]
MIWALYGCCFALMIILAIVAMPSDVRALILENCKCSKGRFRLRYVTKELGSVSRFYGELLFTAAILAIVVGFGLIVLDSVVKTEIIHSAVKQADWDLSKWEKDLRSFPNNVEHKFTQHHISQGGTKESARSIMIFLWRGLPVIMLLCFVAVLLTMRMSSRVFTRALESLVTDETLRNRRRTKQRYLRSTSSFL